MNHKVLLLNAGYSLRGLMRKNPNLRDQFALLGIDFANEVVITDRNQLINQISQSVKENKLLLIVDNAPQLQAREILAQGFNKPLHKDPTAVENLQLYCSRTGRGNTEEMLRGTMIPQGATVLSDPACAQAGFVMSYPSINIVLVSGPSQSTLRLIVNQLYPVLLGKFFPGAVMVDIPLKEGREEDVQDYIERVQDRLYDFLPLLGGTADNPVLRLIAVKEDEKSSRQSCNSFLEDLVSECGNVTTIARIGMKGLRAVEKKQKKSAAVPTDFAQPATGDHPYAPVQQRELASQQKSSIYAVGGTVAAVQPERSTEGMMQQSSGLTDDYLIDGDDFSDDQDDWNEETEWEEKPKKKKKEKKVKKKERDYEEEKPRRSPIIKLLLLLFVLIFLGSVGYLGYYYWKSAQNRSTYESLREVYDSTTLFAPPGYPSDYDKSFAALWEINPDIVGWISIDDTDLDYPVVQTTDNTKYYRMNFEGEYSEHAVPFVDTEVDLKAPSSNIIIYGHNIRTDGQMFNILKGYKDLEYYQQHPVVQFDSVYHEGEYKIFSIFYTNTNASHGEIFPYHEFINAQSTEEMQNYIDDVMIRSIINTGVDVLPTDQLLTLSTCSYEFDDARFVIVARKVRDGESSSVDTSQATMNPTPLYPDIWYQLFGGTKPDEAQLKANLPQYSSSAQAEEPKDTVSAQLDETPMEIQDEEGTFSELADVKYAQTAQQTPAPQEQTVAVQSETEPPQEEATAQSEPPAQESQPEPQVMSEPEQPEQEESTAPQEQDQKQPEPEQPLEQEVPEEPEQTEPELPDKIQTVQEEEEPSMEEPDRIVDSSSLPTLSVQINGSTVRGSAEEIVGRVVEAEMGPTFQTEALKAQAVAAYTYVLYHNEQGTSPSVVAKDSVSSKVASAVQSVLGQALYYNGSYINSTYCASNAGYSMDAQHVWGSYVPYLVSVESPGDTTLKAYGATKTFSESQMAQYIEDYLNVDPYSWGSPEDWFSNPEYINGQYVDTIEVCGQTITGRKVRENLLKAQINSAAFEVTYDGNSFTFTTYGYGHGVGMSQQGADYYAQQGWSYQEILTHYYTGAQLH